MASGATTPIIPGCYPDPSICRVGEEYYLANSSFEWFPGVPIWRSPDLVNWEQVGNAIDQPNKFPAGELRTFQGIYAPTLRFHDGKFWLITTLVGPNTSHVVYSAPEGWDRDPEGAWSGPIYIDGIGGIDPDLAWDEDGTCYLTCCTNSPNDFEISQARIDLDTGTLLEEPRAIWKGTGMQWPEGPHLYHIGEWWYLLTAEGGTERGHTVTVARGRSPEGPFMPCADNPIFTRRSTNHPVASVGHSDLVQTPDGQWALVYLGVQPRGVFPEFHVNGRETYLAGIEWREGWPVVFPERYEVPSGGTDFKERYVKDSESAGDYVDWLTPRWTSPGYAPSQVVSFTEGGLKLVEAHAPNGAPSGMGVRVRDSHWSLEVDVSTAGCPALRLRQDESHWYQVGIENGQAYVRLQIGPVQETETAKIHGDTATLIVRSVEPGEVPSPGPDDIELAVRDDAGEHLLARVDGRYLSTEVAGGFIGRLALIHAQGCVSKPEEPDTETVVYEVRYKPL